MVRIALIIIALVIPLTASAARPDLQIPLASKPNAAQFGLLRAKIAQLGWTQPMINSCIGSTPAALGKDMDGYTKRLLECISALPQAQQ